MSPARVLLADDHMIVTEGLRRILEPNYELVGIAQNGMELIDLARQSDPDVIVADITMPQLNGIDAIAKLQLAGCRAKVIFLTMHRDRTYAAKALEMGASGFVLKHSASSDLLAAIEAALRGERFVSADISACLEDQPRPARLTLRQREVIQLFAEGRPAKQVGSLLGISTRTAENHKARIMTQLGLESSAELVQYAIRHGLVAR
jgi:DNA-binding NarL/FixJ family response regulator